MICIDTTVMIDEFRAKGNRNAPVNQALLRHQHEELIVPCVVAGEYLDGAATLSEERIQEALAILRSRRLAEVSLDVAEHYGRLVSGLRKQGQLSGRSHNDLWIAATARAYGARLLTRNPRHFADVPNLDVIGYES